MAGLLANANPVRRFRDDRLGRANFAKAIASIVRAPRNDGLVVVGIEGPWGAGKSSVLALAASELARDRRNRIVVVSAWRTSSQDQFLSNLSYSMTTALRRDWQGAPWRIAKAKLLRQPLSIIMALCVPLLTLAALVALPEVRGWAKELTEMDTKKLAAALGIFGLPVLAFLYSKLSQPALEGVKTLLGSAKTESIGALERFAFDFDVLGAAQKKGSRFVVLVEDLDRCAPDRLTDVLSAIAQMWAHPKADRIAFLLAYDRKAVLKGLAQGAVKHLITAHAEGSTETGEGARELAADYLDRIVQLELPLPKPDASTGSEQPWTWPAVPAALRGLLYSIGLVSIGLIWLAAEPVRHIAAWSIGLIALLLAVDLAGSWLMRPRIEDAMPADWEQATSEITKWIGEEQLRVQSRILNRAGAARSLRASSGLTSWEAISIAALATRWPHAFGVASLAASRNGAPLDITRSFNEEKVTHAIKEMDAAGLPTEHFTNASKLYDVVSTFSR